MSHYGMLLRCLHWCVVCVMLVYERECQKVGSIWDNDGDFASVEVMRYE